MIVRECKKKNVGGVSKGIVLPTLSFIEDDAMLLMSPSDLGAIMEPKKWFNCTCEDAEHCFRVAYFEGEKPKDHDVYISVHLNHCKSWYKRIWIAIKYIFGKKSSYGDFDEIILDNKQVIKLRDMLTEYIEQEIPNEKERINPR